MPLCTVVRVISVIPHQEFIRVKSIYATTADSVLRYLSSNCKVLSIAVNHQYSILL